MAVNSQIIELRPVAAVEGLLRKLVATNYAYRRRVMHVLMAAPRQRRFLYKFRTLQRVESGPAFTQKSVNELRSILVESLLWLASPEDFNDPFDTWATWTIEGTEEEIRARFRALADEHQSHLPPGDRERIVEQMMRQPRDGLLAQLRQSFAQQRREFGVCCFCGGDPRDVLMWSHYAGAHYGICLQFESARDPPTLMRAIGVEYRPEFKPINWVTDYRHDIGLTLAAKHVHWVAEAERRIIQEGGAHHYVRFAPDALTGVIFGCRANQDVKDKVGELLRERSQRGPPPVKLYYARQNDERYGIDIWGTEAGRGQRWSGRLLPPLSTP